ncbi:hypothetical protein [Moraxella bovoculi]|uniref:hypothetical protein n=1 Tax=Moraxella bovoculi TaxID=386891 RepID=UPI000AE46B45|nr:hypothetical protein [Moraxella bovoculi]
MHDFFKSTLRDDDIKTVKLAWVIFTSFPMNVVFVGVVPVKIAYIVQSNDIALSFKLDNFDDFIVPNAVVFGRHRKKQISPSPKHLKYTAKSVRRLNTARVIKNPIRLIAKHAQNTINAFVPTSPKGLRLQGKKQPNACRPHKQRKDNQNQPQQKHGSA